MVLVGSSYLSQCFYSQCDVYDMHVSPARTLHQTSDEQHENKCVLCYSSRDERGLSTLGTYCACINGYHESCIYAYIADYGVTSCPNCRNVFSACYEPKQLTEHIRDEAHSWARRNVWIAWLTLRTALFCYVVYVSCSLEALPPLTARASFERNFLSSLVTWILGACYGVYSARQRRRIRTALHRARELSTRRMLRIERVLWRRWIEETGSVVGCIVAVHSMWHVTWSWLSPLADWLRSSLIVNLLGWSRSHAEQSLPFVYYIFMALGISLELVTVATMGPSVVESLFSVKYRLWDRRGTRLKIYDRTLRAPSQERKPHRK